MAGLDARFIEIYRERGERSVSGHAVSADEDRNLSRVCHFDKGRDGRRENIVRRDIDEVDLSYHGFCDLLDIIYRGNRFFYDRKANGSGMLLRLVRLDLTIYFTRAVEKPHGLGIRQEDFAHIYLLFDRTTVIDAGDIRFRLLIRFDELRRLKVGDGTADDRNIFDLICDCLRCRSRDPENNVRLIALETCRDALQIRLIPLCILLIDFDLVRSIAFILQPIDHPLIGCIQRTVLHDLHDCDLFLAGSLTAPCRIAAASSIDQCHSCQCCDKPCFYPFVHDDIPFYFSTMLLSDI